MIAYILAFMALFAAVGLLRAVFGPNRYHSTTRRQRMNLAAIAERYKQEQADR